VAIVQFPIRLTNIAQL